jgi:hypothetical protein
MYRPGRQNLIDLHGGVDLDLTRDVTLSLAHHFFWRQNTHDAIYDLSGSVVRAGAGSSKSAIGNEFDAVVNWQLRGTSRLTLATPTSSRGRSFRTPDRRPTWISSTRR